MNVKLVVLGLLMEKARHPYEVQQLLKQTHMKYYMKITKGSLYYTFEQLEKHGFIEVTNIVRDTQRPDRTVYGITEQGRKEFERLLLEQIAKRENILLPIYEALLFAEHVNAERITEKLKEKIEETKAYLSTMEIVYQKKYPAENLSTTYILVGVIMHLKTELQLLENLYEDVQRHELTEIGIDVLQKVLRSQSSS
jgi:DNA-binding PadR family transcriptional regulator